MTHLDIYFIFALVSLITLLTLDVLMMHSPTFTPAPARDEYDDLLEHADACLNALDHHDHRIVFDVFAVFASDYTYTSLLVYDHNALTRDLIDTDDDALRDLFERSSYCPDACLALFRDFARFYQPTRNDVVRMLNDTHDLVEMLRYS